MRALADAMALDQPAIELLDLLRLDPHALARGDTGREAVHNITAVERALDDRTRVAHGQDRLRCEFDRLPVARDRDDLVQAEIVAGEDDGHASTLIR